MGIGAKTIKTGTRVTDSHNQRPRRVGPLGLLGMTGGGTGRSPRMPGERLAKRKVRKEPLVKCRVLPDDLRVRHGAHGPEDSARPRPCSRRGRRVWGQDSLEPHPVVGEGACARVPQ